MATHIIELAQDPEIEMGKVAKALSMDSALSSKVLRIANSPLYAQRRKSENLRQALVVLGLNATLTLALSFSLVKSLRGAKSNGLNYKFYWRRALLAATAARALGDAMRQTLAEEIFLAALLQDVGMLALDQAVPDLYRDGEKLQRDHAALAEHEKKRLQADHAYVGGWLMRTWNLPERLYRAMSTAIRWSWASAPIPRRYSTAASRCRVRWRICFCSIREQRQFAETALCAERSLGLDKNGVRPGARHHRLDDSGDRSHIRVRAAVQAASGTDSRAGARSADAAQPARAARNQYTARAGGRRPRRRRWSSRKRRAAIR